MIKRGFRLNSGISATMSKGILFLMVPTSTYNAEAHNPFLILNPRRTTENGNP